MVSECPYIPETTLTIAVVFRIISNDNTLTIINVGINCVVFARTKLAFFQTKPVSHDMQRCYRIPVDPSIHHHRQQCDHDTVIDSGLKKPCIERQFIDGAIEPVG